MLTDQELAFDLAKFLKELQAIKDVKGPPAFAKASAWFEPGQHNW